VDTASALRSALERAEWDVVLSDFAMPGFDGREALAIVRAGGCDVPFVMVTGFIGEEQAASVMKAGASDFLVKDRLFRLGAVVERELDDVKAGREQRKALARKQQELLQAQKLEAVGRLAGGVAHDFNNLLSVILGFAHMLERRLPADERLSHPAEEITRAAERAAQLTRKLLRLSRKEVPEPRVINVNAVVSSMTAMLRRVIGEDVTLRERLAQHLPPVRVDQGQLEQVILNLALNARDAMPQGGTIAIETASRRRGGGDVVQVSVTDNGCGMVPEIRSHLFEPFFTTKEPGRGTGLGLASVAGIVAEAGGEVAVETEPGRGSAFHVILPAVHEAISPPEPRLEPGEVLSRGNERVLVVEDDPAVRVLLEDVLKDAGYGVLTAGSAREAVRALEGRPDDVSLLLCDVVLPDGRGRTLHEALSRQRPALRALFLSGYTDDEVARAGFADRAEVVRKPIRGTDLLARVRETLDAEPAGRRA
jgi:signal transduction histidine kinase